MSQQKHTPGPYNYGEDRDGWFATHSPTAKLINGHFAEHPMLTCIRAAIARATGDGK